MTDRFKRPDFLASFFSALAERAEAGSLWKMLAVPVIAGAISAAAAYYMPVEFWSDQRWDVSATVYTGVLTVNGLILALSWSAFSRIYESISAPKFSAFLGKHGLLNKYIVTVSFIHALQLFAIVASAAGLLTVLLDMAYLEVDRAIFGIMIFASIVAIQQAATAVGIMNDLLWQKSAFDEYHQGNNGSVVPMDKVK